jgi:hypothetical protein
MNHVTSKLIFLIGFISLLTLENFDNPDLSNSVPILKVDLLKSSGILLSSIISEVKYIPLATDPNAFIGDRTLRIEVFKNKIYTKEQSKVLRFNIDGSFEKQIIQVGRGPDEIMGITDIAFSKDNIFILGRDEVAKLTLDGKLVKKVKVPVTSESIFCYPNGHLLVYYGLTPNGSGLYKIGIYDNNLNLLNNYLPKPQLNGRPVMRHCIHSSEKEVFITQSYNDTILDMTSEIPKPYLVIDFGKQNRTYNSAYVSHRFPTIMDINISNKFWFLTIHHSPELKKREEYSMIYYPEESKYLLAKNKVINDIDYGLNFSPEFTDCIDNQNYLYMFILPADILKRLKELNTDKTRPMPNNGFTKMAKTISEMDNPVLVQCKIK